MRAVLDACVLFPPVMRQTLLAAARLGHFEPVWSPRILEEWVRAVARVDPHAERGLRDHLAELNAAFPAASVLPATLAEDSLPDPDDVHVLGACLAAQAGFLITRNHRDFPTGTLSRHGVSRSDPDPFVTAFAQEDGRLTEAANEIARAVDAAASPRAILKRAGLPRLGKRVAGL
ncbi:MAG: PIN domain-containing protein [Pseudomonadota bacterium]